MSKYNKLGKTEISGGLKLIQRQYTPDQLLASLQNKYLENKIYFLNDFVCYENKLFLSLTDNNLGHQPSQSSQYWKSLDWNFTINDFQNINQIVFTNANVQLDSQNNRKINITIVNGENNNVFAQPCFKFTESNLENNKLNIETNYCATHIIDEEGIQYIIDNYMIRYDFQNMKVQIDLSSIKNFRRIQQIAGQWRVIFSGTY